MDGSATSSQNDGATGVTEDGAGRISLLPQLTKSSIGIRREDGSIAVAADEPQGYVLSGPLCELPPGIYRLDVRCRAGTPAAPAHPVLGLEVIASGKGQQAWRDRDAAELAQDGGAVTFVVPPDPMDVPTKFNFRLYHFGSADLVVAAVDLARIPAIAAPNEPRRWRLISRLRARKIARRDTDGTVAIGRRRRPGCALDGPAAFFLPQGRYRLTLACSTGIPKMPGQPVLGVDVLAGERHRQAWREFSAEELGQGPVAVDFVVPPRLADTTGDAPFSFALFHLGNAAITI
jgi:hypothetical protein